jgi:TolA-binding protein
MGGASADVYQYVGQAYYELKDYKAAVNFFSDLVARKEKAGRRPDRNELILLQSSYQRAGDKAAARATLQKVVRYYPDPSTWALLIHEVKRARLDSRQKLHLYRLMQATGNLKEPQEYMDYSLAAMDTGLMGESEKVLENGIREKVFRADADRSRAERYRKSAAAEAASKRSELARLEAAAKTAGTGNEYISLGTTLYSLGRYDQAVDALRAGIAKGKLTNEADAHLTLGMALLKAGQKAEARKAFSSTKSDDEVTHRIAELWALYTS